MFTLDDLMEKILEKTSELEEIEKKKLEAQESISKLCQELKKNSLGDNKTFQYRGDWYNLKRSSTGKFFIINFGDKKPGSWKKRKTDEKE
jgi:hypothetical protein